MSVVTENLYAATGILLPPDACVVIVRTEWNTAVVDELQKGCTRLLDEYKIEHTILTVPGAFEIPFAIKMYWEVHSETMDKPYAFIALGCVIKGDTPHFDYVCKAVTDGILQLNLTLPVPTIFGVLTINDQQQADERTGGKHGHKGEESAMAVIKMLALHYQLIKI